MSHFKEEEIVLLNCFNYLNIGNQQNKQLGKVICKILDNPMTLKKLTENNPAAMKPENWRNVLKLIQNNEKLSSLRIREQSQLKGYDSKGLNATCFLDSKSKEATFVFRGTGRGEWLDNGEAFSEPNSPQQLEALEYFQDSVNKLKLQEKGYVINVTGHSKGGNKAQFVTINSDIVNKCYSFDGQGFSKEALEQYSDKIQQNRHKIYSINADNDYIHCLGNEIAMHKALYQSKYNNLTEFKYNHCPDAILNEKGGLAKKVNKEPWQNLMINRYSRYLMNLSKDMKKEIFTSFMGLAQMSLGKEPALGRSIPSYKEAKKAFSEASIEFKNWFRQDRNQFNFKQKLVLAAFGAPILKLAQFRYGLKHISFSKMEENILGTLGKDINKEFGKSKSENILQKILGTFKEDLRSLCTHLLKTKENQTIDTGINEQAHLSNSKQQNEVPKMTLEEIKQEIKQMRESKIKSDFDTASKNISPKSNNQIER